MKYAIFLISPFLWLVRIAVFLLFAIPGLAVVAALAWGGVYGLRASPRFGGRLVLRFPSLFAPWDNAEDGIDGLRGSAPEQLWWLQKTSGWSQAKRIFIWSALRNPVDSLRWVPVLNPRIHPERVRFIGMDHEPVKGEGGFYFAWQGPYSCIRFETKSRRFWLGWKLKPTDRGGVSPDDPRAIRCDFAMQLKRIA